MKTGLIAGSFDLLHAGHCIMIKDAKEHCDYLIAALQTDPTIDRSYKNKPVQSIVERQIMLESNKYIDEIIVYCTEAELLEIIKVKRPDVRILGNDWVYNLSNVTGIIYSKEIYIHERKTGWSSAELRERVLMAENNNMQCHDDTSKK